MMSLEASFAHWNRSLSADCYPIHPQFFSLAFGFVSWLVTEMAGLSRLFSLRMTIVLNTEAFAFFWKLWALICKADLARVVSQPFCTGLGTYSCQ